MDSNDETDGSQKNNDSDSDDNQPLGSIIRSPKKNRTSRNVKRPRYNLSTDDDENSFNETTLPKKSRADSDSLEENDDLEDSQQKNQLISISSRGRVRKIKPNARSIFRKE